MKSRNGKNGRSGETEWRIRDKKERKEEEVTRREVNRRRKEEERQGGDMKSRIEQPGRCGGTKRRDEEEA